MWNIVGKKVEKWDIEYTENKKLDLRGVGQMEKNTKTGIWEMSTSKQFDHQQLAIYERYRHNKKIS